MLLRNTEKIFLYANKYYNFVYFGKYNSNDVGSEPIEIVIRDVLM